MRSQANIVSRIRTLCRSYPEKLTASEVVGNTYLALEQEQGVDRKTAFLAEHLRTAELAKLVVAARDGYEACGSFAAVNGFTLGAVVYPAGPAIGLGDRLVPGEFVKQLIHCGQPATGRSA